MEFSDVPAIGFHGPPTSSDFAPGVMSYRYTLTSLLGEFLTELEARYGRRDRTYTLLGIQFGSETPQLWYPGGHGNIIVMLSLSVASYPNGAIFELAHEAVHLLAPSGSRQVLVVEEGLAARFSVEQTHKYGGTPGIITARYAEAAELVGQAEKIAPDFVYKVRAHVPAFTAWTPEILQAIVPTIPPNLAVRLTEPFC